MVMEEEFSSSSSPSYQHCCNHELLPFFSFFFPLAALCCSPFGHRSLSRSKALSKCVDIQADCVDTTGFNCSDFFLGQSSSVDTQGKVLWRVLGRFAYLDVLLAYSCRKDLVWREGNAECLPFFAKVDPSRSGYERNLSWCRVLKAKLPHVATSADRELGLESLKVLGMGLWRCGPQVWCWLVSTVVWLVLVERQLDLSSMAARLR
ncbi:hypothetical protein Taro_044973, partial [Colocasia esculenta]|nr:hypothetical protein [Colocasia esculenta]